MELDKAVSIMGQAQLGKALPEEEVGDVVAFLGTLTGDVPEKVRVLPLLPPSTDPASRPDNGNGSSNKHLQHRPSGKLSDGLCCCNDFLYPFKE